MNSTFDIRRFGYYLKLNMKTSAVQFMYMAIAMSILNLWNLADKANLLIDFGLDSALLLTLFIILAPCILEKNLNKQNSVFGFILPVSNAERFLYLLLKYMILLPLLLLLITYAFDAVFIYLDYKTPHNFQYYNIQYVMTIQSISFLCYLYFRKHITGKAILAISLFIPLFFSIINCSMSLYNIRFEYSASVFKMLSPCAFMQSYALQPQLPLIIMEWILKLLLPFGLWVAAYFKLKEIEI